MKILASVVLLAALVASFVAGMYTSRQQDAFLLKLQTEVAQAEFINSQQAALSSGDARRIEEALWAQIFFHQSIEVTPSAFRSAAIDAVEQVLSFARLSELATAKGETERAAWLMTRAESACKKTNWQACSPAEILAVVRKLAISSNSVQAK